MKTFDPTRVNVEFRNGIQAVKPILGRKYTMTHSDDTAELFVTIGTDFAEEKIGPLRDEVLLQFQEKDGRLQLFGSVLIDDDINAQDSKKRNEIFLREMPTALQAIRYADRRLYDRHPMLDTIPIYIWFQSEKEEYNKLYHVGTMQEYRFYQ